MNLLTLFTAFLRVGLFSVGGGYAAVPLIESLAVNQYEWLSAAEFAQLLSIAEMTPGPIVVNAATFVGIRMAGIPGAVVATLGSILPSVILMTVLALLYRRFRTLKSVQTVLGTLRPAVVALIASAFITILISCLYHSGQVTPGETDWLALLVFIGAFAAIRWGKKRSIPVMIVCGAVYMVLGLIFPQLLP